MGVRVILEVVVVVVVDVTLVIMAMLFFVLLLESTYAHRHTYIQTDRQAYGQTDGRTDIRIYRDRIMSDRVSESAKRC